MEFIDTPFHESTTSTSPIEPNRHRQPKTPLPELGLCDECVVSVYLQRLFSISQKFDIKYFYFPLVGADIYPDNLTRLSQKLTKRLYFPTKSKIQYLYYVRDAFTGVDLRIEVSLPGGTRLWVWEEEKKRNAKLEDLDRCYISSILRYIQADTIVGAERCIFDPFEEDYDKFQHFMNTLCRITRDYDIKFNGSFDSDEMNLNFKSPLKILAKFITESKLANWVKRYFTSVEIDAKTCLKHSPHMIRFYTEIFVSGGEHELAASILFNQSVLMVIPQPLKNFYLSKMAKSKEQQLFILKTIGYVNKSEIWREMANYFMSTRYTSDEILSKVLVILDFLAQKKDESKGKKNPVSLSMKPLSLKRKLEFLPEVSCYPTNYRLLSSRNYKLKQFNGANKQILQLRKQINSYYALTPTKRQVIMKLSKIMKALSHDQFNKLFKQTFQQPKRQTNHNNIKEKLPHIQNIQQRTIIDMQSERFPFPSFIATDLQDKILLINRSDQDTSTLPLTSEYNSNVISWGGQQKNLSKGQQTIDAQDQHHKPTKIKRIASASLESLINFAHQIRKALDNVIVKLEIDQQRVQSLKTLNLSIENTIVMAEACLLCGHVIFAAHMLVSIKKRMQDFDQPRVDMYTYHKLFSIMVEMNNCDGFLIFLADFLVDLQKLGVYEMSRLPNWIQSNLFELISKRGRTHIQTMAKSINITSQAFRNSIIWYQELHKEA